jgi:hypothetical protein
VWKTLWTTKKRQEGKPLMKKPIALVILLAIASTAGVCTRTTNYYTNPSPIPIPTAPTADTIEFRVFGNPGAVPVLIKFTNSIDGATAITAVSLPYVATVRSTEAAIFLDVEASAVPLIASTASLQAQIYVNGKLFREAIAIGVSPLTVSAAGTWRR